MSVRSRWGLGVGKRAFDITMAGVALVLLSPLLAVVAIVVDWSLGRPVVFRQFRAGYLGEPFLMYKFRTMLPEQSAGGTALDESERITQTGRRLRSASLDELPNLYNVLRGDMSLVGPRPLPVDYVDRYSAVQARRLLVRPGITGLAQVRGRNTLAWEEKFTSDIEYVESANFVMDIKILAMTVVRVLRRDGIATAGHTTSPVFLGSTPVNAPPLAGPREADVLSPTNGTDK